MSTAYADPEARVARPGQIDYRTRVGFFCSKLGAEQLAGHIKSHWRAKGYDVNVWVVAARRGFDDIEAAMLARYDVRSDMVNGRPVRRIAQ